MFCFKQTMLTRQDFDPILFKIYLSERHTGKRLHEMDMVCYTYIFLSVFEVTPLYDILYDTLAYSCKLIVIAIVCLDHCSSSTTRCVVCSYCWPQRIEIWHRLLKCHERWYWVWSKHSNTELQSCIQRIMRFGVQT